MNNVEKVVECLAYIAMASAFVWMVWRMTRRAERIADARALEVELNIRCMKKELAEDDWKQG